MRDYCNLEDALQIIGSPGFLCKHCLKNFRCHKEAKGHQVICNDNPAKIDENKRQGFEIKDNIFHCTFPNCKVTRTSKQNFLKHYRDRHSANLFPEAQNSESVAEGQESNDTHERLLPISSSALKSHGKTSLHFVFASVGIFKLK